MPSQQEILAALHLNALHDVGPARFQQLIERFGSAVEAVKAQPRSWRGVRLFDSEILDKIRADWETAYALASQDAAIAEKKGIALLLLHEGVYPSRLRQIPSPPPVLYVQGKKFDPDAVAVALVGSRRSSYYAEKTARWISEELCRAGVVNVSGLARGIDTCVHDATLKAEGCTWAVLGSGLSWLYPAENKKLAEAIVESGALISEFPMASRPHPSSFPRRNRIISGLCIGTVVIEGSEKSGSLITARLAADQGREVMAVPGPIRAPGSGAPHLLIKAGATLVESADDILNAIGIRTQPGGQSPARAIELSAPFESVLSQLDHEPVPREVLAMRLQKSVPELTTLLLELEMQGLVRCLTSGAVVKV
jgi:DNA processing protein